MTKHIFLLPLLLSRGLFPLCFPPYPTLRPITARGAPSATIFIDAVRSPEPLGAPAQEGLAGREAQQREETLFDEVNANFDQVTSAWRSERCAYVCDSTAMRVGSTGRLSSFHVHNTAHPKQAPHNTRHRLLTLAATQEGQRSGLCPKIQPPWRSLHTRFHERGRSVGERRACGTT